MLIDVPSDLAGEQMVFHYPDSVGIPSYRPTYRGNAKQVKQAVELIRAARRPLLMVGGGVVSSHACDEVVELAETMRIPVVTTLLGKAAMPCSNPLNLGPVGMHGSKYANMAVKKGPSRKIPWMRAIGSSPGSAAASATLAQASESC